MSTNQSVLQDSKTTSKTRCCRIMLMKLGFVVDEEQMLFIVRRTVSPPNFDDDLEEKFCTHNKVAIGYKNPLCLTRAKQVQPALYNGHVLVMSNHARPVVHDSEDTRDMAEITRKKMMEKMQSP
ncbi:hypothetical protein Tco_0873438 [Tanacetum coccineum]|uniref:Uncharacterized protein n=1 Tax=Tanacetum coccineum TaxID=301880 RepID=A0ABQ5BLP8_9ASTR